MKKQYMTPTTDVVVLEHKSAIMSASGAYKSTANPHASAFDGLLG